MERFSIFVVKFISGQAHWIIILVFPFSGSKIWGSCCRKIVGLSSAKFHEEIVMFHMKNIRHLEGIKSISRHSQIHCSLIKPPFCLVKSHERIPFLMGFCAAWLKQSQTSNYGVDIMGILLIESIESLQKKVKNIKLYPHDTVDGCEILHQWIGDKYIPS